MKEIFRIENPHWINILYNYEQTREIYSKLEQQMGHKLILSIEGPRRVGKTVLMHQLINYLIKSGVNPHDILYHSFDKYSQDPIKVLLEYEKVREKSLREGKAYLFFDELQKVNDWQTNIKIIYDNYPNVKLIISGSSLRQSKKESLAGRIFEYFVKPLSFKEYLLFSGKKNLLDVKEKLLINEYNIYLFKQYPDLAFDFNIDVKTYVGNIIKKVVFEDSEKFINNVNKDLLHSILNIILRSPGQIIEYTDLAKDLGTDRKIVSEYLEFLINSSLIRKVYNFSNNARKIETRGKKFYPFCTTLIKYVDDNPILSKVVETYVAFQIDSEFFWNERLEEIDFILNENKRIGVEVKYKNTLDNTEIKTFNSQNSSRLKLAKKYLIIKENAKINFQDKTIITIPYYVLWKTKL